MIKVYEYPKCTTCRKAKKFLEEKGLEFEAVDMVAAPPSVEALDRLVKQSGRNVDAFFNSRGKAFKELNLKEALGDLSYYEKLELLSKDGMLIKRPMVDYEAGVFLGFKEDEYIEKLQL
ncbi:Spx/MgsR family RNA polymerase-binding regulatory protein [Phocicoccus pinnipedialis]|uniref:Regulatory protein MgsR n=1 Tax=Phocicoccus pinnipedialis TaxID=110845 RepID=A0A6V7R789_9BACL|nr:Spx/MgsR family RNA polymerase-binding regulatory protein [Jeotgalicoccus pinnipedialis]MBP1938847.1 arsenate reductase [Jeotgalicoccus pinnipedialis]CAD2073320.1 Regulatory protein MgsR [Jeotgalicoccus pinnipedialis]